MRVQMAVIAGALVAAMMAVSTETGRSQNSPYQSPSQSSDSSAQHSTANPRMDLSREPESDRARIAERQAISMNTERQKKLLDDTQKLLALATELKTAVDKSTKDTLSLDVIKKADEIEKLAHSVKERMKD